MKFEFQTHNCKIDKLGEYMQIVAKLLTREDFSPYGQVIQKKDANNFLINDGKCTRFS